jgi:hypothetical protein
MVPASLMALTLVLVLVEKAPILSMTHCPAGLVHRTAWDTLVSWTLYPTASPASLTANASAWPPRVGSRMTVMPPAGALA